MSSETSISSQLYCEHCGHEVGYHLAMSEVLLCAHKPCDCRGWFGGRPATKAEIADLIDKAGLKQQPDPPIRSLWRELRDAEVAHERERLRLATEVQRLEAERLAAVSKATRLVNQVSNETATLTNDELDELRDADCEYPWKPRDLLRLARENRLLRAEVKESNTFCEPCESVYFVLRSNDGIDYPPTKCNKCGRVERLAHIGEDCPKLECDGTLGLDE